MSIFRSFRFPPGFEHKLALSLRDDACIRYAQVRKETCSINELLDLWVRVPYCSGCAASRPFGWGDPADITGGRNWKASLEASLGDGTLEEVLNLLRDDESFAFTCHKCHCRLRPWRRDDVYVEMKHLEEYFGIRTEADGQVQPSRRLRQLVFRAYHNECFACGSRINLHIDHIRPRARAGDAAFRNLQPLCESCGQSKADSDADERWVCDDDYFISVAGDSYDGLLG